MYRPRRVRRGTTSFPSDAWSALFVCAWCAGYSASDGSRSMARTTVHRWTNWHHVWFAKASIKEHNTNPLRRHPSPRWWRLRPIAHCVIRRPCYLQIRNASTPPSPTRRRRRRHGRTPTCPNRKRPTRPSETRRRHCSRSDRTSRGKR